MGLATLAGLEDELAQDDFLYRFRQQPGPLGDAEGAFLLCGFTLALALALALHQQGREVEATRWFERNRAACGPPTPRQPAPSLCARPDVRERRPPCPPVARPHQPCLA